MISKHGQKQWVHPQLGLPRNPAKQLRPALMQERLQLHLVLHLQRAVRGDPSLQLKSSYVKLYTETEQLLPASTSPGCASPAQSV